MADLMPIVSWLIQGGKCRYCFDKISSRYLWVELVNGLIWGGLWWQYFVVTGDVATGIFYALAASALVAIIWIDWELYLIPDQINAFLAFVGIGYNIWLFIDHRPEAMTWGIPSALAGWITGVAVLWGIAFLGRILFKKDAMGHGDIKMSRGVGAVLFPAVATISFALAVALGAVIGTIMIFVGRAMESKAKASLASGEDGEAEQMDGEEAYEPESIASLLKSGLGYLLGIDIIGLFSVKLYENWFGENPYDVPEDLDTFKPSLTMIPFGPYLALGAIIAAVFSRQLLGAVENYLNLQPNGAFLWEHFQRVAGLNLLG
jgi:leader peptidase (prepilin peptidase) / N-methyltransferase